MNEYGQETSFLVLGLVHAKYIGIQKLIKIKLYGAIVLYFLFLN